MAVGAAGGGYDIGTVGSWWGNGTSRERWSIRTGSAAGGGVFAGRWMSWKRGRYADLAKLARAKRTQHGKPDCGNSWRTFVAGFAGVLCGDPDRFQSVRQIGLIIVRHDAGLMYMRNSSDTLAVYEPWRRRTIFGATCILVIVGISAGLVILLPQLGQWNGRILSKLSLFCSAVLPPIWFWCEFTVIWSTAPENERPRFEYFRYGQEISRNVWLAYVAVLLALYFR